MPLDAKTQLHEPQMNDENYIPRLRLSVVRAEGLAARDLIGSSDPFVRVFVGPSSSKTKVVKNSLNPIWNEKIDLDLFDPMTDVLLVCVWDWNRFTRNDFLGETRIKARDVIKFSKDHEQEHSFELMPRNDKEAGIVKGSIFLKFENISKLSKFMGSRLAWWPVVRSQNISSDINIASHQKLIVPIEERRLLFSVKNQRFGEQSKVGFQTHGFSLPHFSQIQNLEDAKAIYAFNFISFDILSEQQEKSKKGALSFFKRTKKTFDMIKVRICVDDTWIHMVLEDSYTVLDRKSVLNPVVIRMPKFTNDRLVITFNDNSVWKLWFPGDNGITDFMIKLSLSLARMKINAPFKTNLPRNQASDLQMDRDLKNPMLEMSKRFIAYSDCCKSPAYLNVLRSIELFQKIEKQERFCVLKCSQAEVAAFFASSLSNPHMFNKYIAFDVDINSAADSKNLHKAAGYGAGMLLLSGLQELKLMNFFFDVEFLSEVVRCIRENSLPIALEVFDLSHSRNLENCSSHLMSLLQFTKDLRKLDLSNCGLSGECFDLVQDQKWLSLNSMCLKGNMLNASGSSAVIARWISHGKFLRELDLSETRVDLSILKEVIAYHNCLQSLTLKKIQDSNEAIKHLVFMLQMNDSIQKLDLEEWDLSYESDALVRALSRRHFAALCLCKVKGFQHFAKSLSMERDFNVSLIDISMAKVTYSALVDFVDALCRQNTIQELILDGIHEDEVAHGLNDLEFLGELFRNCKSLRSLSIQGTTVSTHGVDRFYEKMGNQFIHLTENRTLEDLYVANNRFGNEGLILLGNALRKNRSIRRVKIDGQHGSLVGYLALRGCLFGNKKLIQMDYPKHDLEVYLSSVNTEIASQRMLESKARMDIKVACRRKPKDMRSKNAALGRLRNSIRERKRLDREKQKMETTIVTIMSSIVDNERYYDKLNLHKKDNQRSKEAKLQSLIQSRWEQRLSKLVKKCFISITKKLEIFILADRNLGLDIKAVIESANVNDGPTHITMLLLKYIIFSNRRFKKIAGPALINNLEWIAGVTSSESKLSRFISEKNVHALNEKLSLRRITNRSSKRVDNGDDDERISDAFYQSDDHCSSDDDAKKCDESSESARQSGAAEKDAGGDIAASVAVVSAGIAAAIISAELLDQLHSSEIMRDLNPELEELPHDLDVFIADIQGSHDDNDGIEVDDLVEMYGSAGPRDLEDGGPSGETGSVLTGSITKKFSFKSHRQELEELFISYTDNKGTLVNQEGRASSLSFQELDLLSWKNTLEQIFKYQEYIPELTVFEVLTNSGAYVTTENNDITLVTQCSIDRLGNLENQARWWTGPFVACIFIDPYSTSKLLSVSKLHHKMSSLVHSRSLTFAIVGYKSPAAVMDRDYPINQLRNIAMSYVMTDLQFLLDVDFIGIKDCYERLFQIRDKLLLRCSNKTAVVVPAFEHTFMPGKSTEDVLSPSLSLNDLTSLLKTGEAYPFHINHFPQGHRSSDFEKWESTRPLEFYNVKYEDGFEPYIICCREGLPKFDERFRGYGMNKIQHALHLSFLGFRFSVLGGVFVIAKEHERSDSWRKIYGPDADHQERLKLKSLFSLFKRELDHQFCNSYA